MIYLKMLFEPKNLKRKETFYKETMPKTQFVETYSQDTIRDLLFKVGLQ